MNYAARIVIPLLRQADVWLKQCLLSALQQSVPTEVVDTTFESQDIGDLQSKHRDLRVVCERNPGNFPNAINTGFACAQADRVGLLLSDDWLEKNAVAACMAKPADIVSTGNTVYFSDRRVNKAACGKPSMARYLSLATLEEKASHQQHFFLSARRWPCGSVWMKPLGIFLA